MSWMHDRALAPRNRRRSQQTPAVTSSPGFPSGAAPEEVTAGLAVGLLEPVSHVGIPRILGRRARWVTSRLRQR
ncbi:hypothetical protein ABIA32_005611 [Streptacidiphilus sp. MAP12-20]|uniref:hypothetical protein n=1 Tax=Streptacidiphilus sp. MAP12-20 TaxID=3156299 RepID=UPI003512EA56